jgi:hypothetical protein
VTATADGTARWGSGVECTLALGPKVLQTVTLHPSFFGGTFPIALQGAGMLTSGNITLTCSGSGRTSTSNISLTAYVLSAIN